MQEYDLAVFAILWGTAIAFALAALTMVDSGRKKLLELVGRIGAEGVIRHLSGSNGGSLIRPRGLGIKRPAINF